MYCGSCEPLHEGQPASIEAAPPPVEPLAEPSKPRVRPARWLVAPVAISLAGAVYLSSWAMASTGAAAGAAFGVAAQPVASAQIDVQLDVPLAREPSASVAADTTPTAPIAAAAASLAARWPMPVWDGVPLDEVYPSLRGWVHPVTNAKEIVPESGGRKFGALREGILRPECGAGHCGVDLDGPRGQPMVSVAAGRVVRLEYSEMGRDGRSGRYVRIEHEDGTLTAYMHLDVIAPDLAVGDRVDAGQYIGTLGASGILASAPHCHFTLELPLSTEVHGDHTQTRYIDPSPFLARSRVTSPVTRGADTARW